MRKDTDTAVLQAAYEAWSAASERRSQRARNKRYTYGDQWADIITDSDGRRCREGDLIRRGGREPISNNLIRRIVKTLVGRYRSMSRENGRYNEERGSLASLNDLAELDSRLLEEFLISGCAVQRVAPDVRPAGSGIWVENVSPASFFTGPFRDPRGIDADMVGMLHEMSRSELLARFGGGDRTRMDRLEALYSLDGSLPPGGITGADSDFYTPRAPGRCRVIEVWTLEGTFPDKGRPYFEWRCRWLTPGGDLLAGYTSPWAHRSHPFVFKLYPYTDGEVHPFVEDVIDQQRYINRLVMTIDRMMGASAKGVLLFPTSQKPSGFSWDEILRRWSAADGVIPVTGRSSVMPQQIQGNGADAGAYRLLELQMKLFEEISGVSDVLLGRNVPGGNGGSALYESQVTNSTMALADIFDTFESLTRKRDAKAAQCRIRE